MITKSKTIFELIGIACTCACSFPFLQKQVVNYAQSGDVIHTITIGYGYNKFPEAMGYCTLVNEVGTEVNCLVLASVKELEFHYNEGLCFVTNYGLADKSYNITFYVNGVVSFDLNSTYDSYEASMTFFRDDQFYLARDGSQIHIQDEEALTTSAELSFEIPSKADFAFQSMVLKYSESSCRELSKK